ncbi:hypothetical protein B0G80_1289 [Paraburkholderia sp. BL6669N2]|uniref:hypothetical protein n=1 Tax=Paraburkholderia sp. BL6669N2 TaxID=1938807 RepID=UPI000E24DF58|nr:hypothetical protein [Paraburkholderia sp. BL6669N2]REG58627.1 hypothetical protein B0G80_1289 [Paraburkholderia sp. BL6669N2]
MNWLGILHLETEDAVLESSVELEARHAVMPFSVGDPSFWTVPFLNEIATGAEPQGNKVPTDAASRGIVDAARRLDGKVQLIIGNCGFMWASRNVLYRTTSAATITSGLEFLDVALRITGRSVGIITWDVQALNKLLSGHPELERIRLLAVGDLPEWQKSWTYREPADWTKERMADELAERLSEAFGEGGVLRDISVLIFECTLVPDFRNVIRRFTAVPIFDLLQFAKAALE